MNLLIGIPILLIGVVLTIITFKEIKIKRKMSFIWGGYTLFLFSIFLICFGIFIIKNGI